MRELLVGQPQTPGIFFGMGECSMMLKLRLEFALPGETERSAAGTQLCQDYPRPSASMLRHLLPQTNYRELDSVAIMMPNQLTIVSRKHRLIKAYAIRRVQSKAAVSQSALVTPRWNGNVVQKGQNCVQGALPASR